jgi:hypothetical protein
MFFKIYVFFRTVLETLSRIMFYFILRLVTIRYPKYFDRFNDATDSKRFN